MQGSLQHKILQHETVPPSSCWENISLRLNEEYSPADHSLSSRMDQAALAAPNSSWSSIVSLLHPAEKTPVRVIPLLYKRISIAAILAGLITATSLYLFTTNKTISSGANEPARTAVSNIPAAALPAPSAERSSAPPPSSEKNPFVSSEKLSGILSRTVKKIKQEIYEPPIMRQVNMSNVQTVAALSPVSVSAPLIRDAQGNIIMDLDVISKPNDPYIVVTSPSGKQTRISNKFLNCLSSLNGDYSVSDNASNSEWKTRFQQWREKLVSEASFVPSANNFFDIFEMKEMIEER